MPHRREGPIKNKQTGYYYLDIFVGFGKDKKRIRYSLKTKDPDKAQFLWEQEWRKQWRDYYGLKAPERPQEAFLRDIIGDYISYERDIKRIKEWKLYKQRLSTIDAFLGNLALVDITKEKLIQLDRHLKDLEKSKATINHYFTLLKGLFNYAIREGKYRDRNPVNDIRPYPVDEKRREYSSEELKRILEAADKIEKKAGSRAFNQKHIKKIILLLLYTGMRLSEVMNLRWDNIQDNKIVLKRTETKQRKEKVIPLTKGIQEVLESLKGKDPDLVIPLSPGKNRSKVWMTDTMRKIRRLSGVQDFIFHNLRHTASTIMVSEAIGKGVGLSDIMKILGHSQISTTMKYLHADFDRMKKAMEILESSTKED